MGTAQPKVEVVDAATGEIMEDMPEPTALAPATQMGVEGYKPTTLLDYSALMLAARQFKRDPIEALKEAARICTLDEETAKECFYSLPRAGRKITGPSIGLAQTMAVCYGNMNVTVDDIRVLKEDGVVEIRGFILDCQTGLTTSDIVRRNIRYGPDHKKFPGQVYDEDMISTTIAAAKSILWRNLVLRIIPRPLVRKVYKAALGVATGDKDTFAQRQGKCVAYWEKTYNIDKSKLLLHLGLTEIADIGISDFEYLLGIENAIKQGDTTIEKIFKKDIIPPPPGQKPENLDQVKADLQAKQAATAQEEPQPEVPAPVVEPTPETPVPPPTQAPAPPVPSPPTEVPPESPQAPTPAPEAPQEPELPPAATGAPPGPDFEPETAQIDLPGDSPPAPAEKPPGAPIPRPGGPAKKT